MLGNEYFHGSSGNPFTTYQCSVYELESGRVREQTVYMNFLDVYVQAGLGPRTRSRRSLRLADYLAGVTGAVAGSHLKFKRVDSAGDVIAIVPNFPEIPAGTVASIARQAKLTWAVADWRRSSCLLATANG